MENPTVAIVGRPNVGKSTLFNRLIAERKAVVEKSPNVTRDRIYGRARWKGETFEVVDTGGLDLESSAEIAQNIKYQVDKAIEEADIILFVVDVREGISPLDREISQKLRKCDREVIVAANKMDDFSAQDEPWEFYNLGFEDVLPISAEHGKNIGDLCDKIFARIDIDDFKKNSADDKEILGVAIAGKPNSGKSTLVNQILGQERVIVSPEPGTTRDAVDSIFERADNKFKLIDTAGLRKKSKVEEDVEYYSNLRAIRAIERADVVVMMIDSVEGITEQDKKIAGYAHDEGRPIILALNKWDLIEKDTHTADIFREEVYRQMKFLRFAPVIFISALTGKRVGEVLDLIEYVYDQTLQRISTGLLNEVVEEAVQMNDPPAYKGKKLNIYYATQPEVQPPVFVFFVNDPELVHFAYERYLENKIREAFGFVGTPIILKFKER
nr:ribosome biogenesis GTPase Der [Halarsenatibacter silvermanii]